jgi:phosphatidyl-myo-inositol dimannoside synthase
MAELLVSLEQRFLRDPNGRIWTDSGFDSDFWARYLRVFSDVLIVARVANVPELPAGVSRVCGYGVSVEGLPNYRGAFGYLRARRELARITKTAADATRVAIVRLPSPIGTLVVREMCRRRRPYGVEVVADPYDIFARGVVSHPARPIIQWKMVKELRRSCECAVGVAYVTRSALQRRYPCGGKQLSVLSGECNASATRIGLPLTTTYSSVELPPDAFVSTTMAKCSNEFRIVTVGTFEQMYKGHDVLLKAVANAVAEGADLTVTLVGDGHYLPEMRSLAERLGLGGRACFPGHLSPRAAVQRELDKAQLFVLASRTEGLPRALIEAMARGLPAVASTVGGIPELLRTQDLVKPGDVDGLTQRILEFYRSPTRRAEAGARNLLEAEQYSAAVLRDRRDAFYEHVRAASPLTAIGGSARQMSTLV